MITIKQTDKFFYNSPDTGHPECLCSRCGKLIEEDEIPIRCWPTAPGDFGFDPNAKGGTEFRYCEQCCKAMGIVFASDDGDL